MATVRPGGMPIPRGRKPPRVPHGYRRLPVLASEGSQREEAIVVVTADHGELLGDHCLYGKRSWYDGASRMPLIIASPSGLPAGRQNGDLVSHLDVMPTLLDLAGLPFRREDLAGRSLLPLVAGERGAAREVLLGQYGENEMAIYVCMDERDEYINTAAGGARRD